jgi:DHA3 family tetracycline resistance protein-like MFS transporter
LFKLDAYKVYLTLEGASSLIFAIIFTVNMFYQVTIAELTPLQLVLVGTVLELSIFLFEVPTGVIADVYSRRLSIIIGYIIIGAGFILEGSIPTFLAIALGQALWGLGYTFTSGATEAWLSDEVGEQAAGRAFLRGSQAGTLGGLIGIGASVVLGSIRVNVPIVVGGVLFALLGLILILVMPEEGFKPTPREQRDTAGSMVHTLRGSVRMIRLRPALLTILAIGLFYGLYSEGYDRLWTRHLLDSFTLPELGSLEPVVWFGIINAVGMLLSIGGIEIARRIVDTTSYLGVARALLAITTVLIISLIGFARTEYFVLSLSLIWVIRVTRNIIGPLYTAWVNQGLDSQVRATVLSMSGQVDAIGQILGGPIMGLIGSNISVKAAITASGLILSPVLAFYGWATRRGEPEFEGAVEAE